ncbi:hypothetical protein [uncultured Ruthenibacterium sp.]|uniref:hypothetical protein n=1 Tax=uncultured Ruthenibacterium sp. TaxID=1905347 RepID=UPI00349EF9BB
MDTLLEILVEGIVEGSMAGAKSRKVPLVVRVILAVFLFAFLAGAGTLFLWFALASDGTWPVRLIALAAGVLLWVRVIQLARVLLAQRRKKGAFSKKRMLFVLVAVIVLLTAFCALLCIKLQVRNPVVAAAGLAEILFTDAQYVEIQENPKVVLAQPHASLEDYMDGYGYDQHEQMGSLWVFSRQDSRFMVHCTQNKYFSRWSWQQ